MTRLRIPDARVAIHAALTAVMLWLSFVLSLPGETFAITSFAFFRSVATEHEWANLLFAVGCIGVLGIATDRRWVCLMSVFVLATMHGTIAWCFALSPPPGTMVGTATGTYAIIAGLGYYLAIRRFAE